MRRRKTAEKVLGWEGLETLAGGQARFAGDTSPETHADTPAYTGGFYGEGGRSSMKGRIAHDRIALRSFSNGTLAGYVRPVKRSGTHRLASLRGPGPAAALTPSSWKSEKDARFT